MARSRTTQRHRGVQGLHAAVHLAILNDGPRSRIILRNFNDRAAMCGHLDIDQLFGHALKTRAVLTAKTGEHDLFVRVFMVHTEQPTCASVIERDKPHVVVVIAKLAELCRSGLVHHVKVGRIREYWISPTQQDLRLITVGDVVCLIIAPGQLVKGISALRRSFGSVWRDQRRGAKKGSGRRYAEHSAQYIAAAIASVDHVADGPAEVWVRGDVIEGLVGFGFVSDAGIADNVTAVHCSLLTWVDACHRCAAILSQLYDG